MMDINDFNKSKYGSFRFYLTKARMPYKLTFRDLVILTIFNIPVQTLCAYALSYIAPGYRRLSNVGFVEFISRFFVINSRPNPAFVFMLFNLFVLILGIIYKIRGRGLFQPKLSKNRLLHKPSYAFASTNNSNKTISTKLLQGNGFNLELLGDSHIRYIRADNREIDFDANIPSDSLSTIILFIQNSPSHWQKPYETEMITDEERKTIIANIRLVLESTGSSLETI